jgi:hypothetical protein
LQSLHNIVKHDAATPLVIFIPPFSQPAEATPLPSCFWDYPAAVINYRWQAPEGHDRPQAPFHWPTPLHDINFAYSWIKDNLGAGTDVSTAPRPAYVYGSYLGATLAAALALTESYVPVAGHSMTIRGLIAHNGIYNWTMFLPDHPIHSIKPKSKRKKGNNFPLSLRAFLEPPTPVEEEGIFTTLKDQTPALFSTPANLFDPFASPCLFFHSPNLHVPDDFTTPLTASTSSLPSDFTAAVDALANHSRSPSEPFTSPSDIDPESADADALLEAATLRAKLLKPPRKGYLTYPPLPSSSSSFPSSSSSPPLRIPPTLFLYSTPRVSSSSAKPNWKPRPLRNSFAFQASELAGLMLRSVDMYEMSGHRRYGGGGRKGKGRGLEGEEMEVMEQRQGEFEEVEDHDGDRGVEGGWDRREEVERRVQTFEIKPAGKSKHGQGDGEETGLGLDAGAEEVVGEWLRERIDEDFGEGGGEA